MQIKEKELPLQFIGKGDVKGHQFQQLKKSDKAYLYQKTIPEGVVYYEVFKRKINRRFKSVSYPRTEHFSIWAWTYMDYKQALDKFNALSA
jgi:hypothetical protein